MLPVMLHLLSAVAAVLVIALITTQFVAYQSFNASTDDSIARRTYKPPCVLTACCCTDRAQKAPYEACVL